MSASAAAARVSTIHSSPDTIIYAVATVSLLFIIPLLTLLCQCTNCFSSRGEETEQVDVPSAEQRKKDALAVLVDHKVTASDLHRLDSKHGDLNNIERRVNVGEKEGDFSNNADIEAQSVEAVVGNFADRIMNEESTRMEGGSASTAAHSSFNGQMMSDAQRANAIEPPCQITIPPRLLLRDSSLSVDSNTTGITATPVDQPNDDNMASTTSGGVKRSLSFIHKLMTDGNTLRNSLIRSRIPDLSTTCAICLNEYKEGDTVCWSKHPSCNHAFHQHCLLPWLISYDTCPTCRWNFFTKKASSTSTVIPFDYAF